MALAEIRAIKELVSTLKGQLDETKEQLIATSQELTKAQDLLALQHKQEIAQQNELNEHVCKMTYALVKGPHQFSMGLDYLRSCKFCKW